jgi:hypothetical protein
MNPIATSCVIFACVFGGALLGMTLQNFLPEHHFDPDSRTIVNLGMALVGTMSALLLSLLIASAKSSFDAQRSEITQMSADIVQLDRVLSRYGPEAAGVRAALRRVVTAADRNWAEGDSRSQWLDSPEIRAGVASLYEKVQELTPHNDFQRSLQSQALQMGIELGKMRSLLLEQAGSSIPCPFLVVVVFWLSMIFTSFGLFSPRNATVVSRPCSFARCPCQERFS